MKVDFSVLQDAFEFVNSAQPFANEAYVCIKTQEVYFYSALAGALTEIPDDVEDQSKYISLPHINNLIPARKVRNKFVALHIPEHDDEVDKIFSRRGDLKTS